jgi:hypothetical protein
MPTPTPSTVCSSQRPPNLRNAPTAAPSHHPTSSRCLRILRCRRSWVTGLTTLGSMMLPLKCLGRWAAGLHLLKIEQKRSRSRWQANATQPQFGMYEKGCPFSCANDCGRVAMLNGLAPRLGDAIRQCVICAGGRGDLHPGPTGKSGWLPEESASIAWLSLWRAEALCFLRAAVTRAAAAFVACDARFFALVRLQCSASVAHSSIYMERLPSQPLQQYKHSFGSTSI